MHDASSQKARTRARRIAASIVIGSIVACATANCTSSDGTGLPDYDVDYDAGARPRPDAGATLPVERPSNPTLPDVDAGDGGTFVPPCQDKCPTQDATECDPGSDGRYRICDKQADGCLDWKSFDCKGGVQKCADAKSACIGTCPAAPCSAGQNECRSGGKWRTCIRNGDGCLAWGGDKACNDGVTSCSASTDKACFGTCTGFQCTLGLKSCVSPDTWKQCVRGAGGCHVYTSPSACARSLPSPGCFAYQKACVGDCVDGCSSIGVSCTGPYSYVRCRYNTSTYCRETVSGRCDGAPQVCFSNPAACAN